MSYEEKNLDDARTLTETDSPKQNSLSEIFRFALIALIIVLPIRWYIAQPFIVSGASMEETFHNNEYLIVDQVTYRFDEPERGDVIIFKYPRDHSKYFIKRIIGLPGETVVIDGSSVTIKNDENPDGMILDESYAALGSARFDQTVTLGDGEYFVMGDNRDHSSDSRSWGVLKREEIVGRALLRLLPPGRADLMPGSVDKSS
jgi:signal peptidase I